MMADKLNENLTILTSMEKPNQIFNEPQQMMMNLQDTKIKLKKKKSQIRIHKKNTNYLQANFDSYELTDPNHEYADHLQTIISKLSTTMGAMAPSPEFIPDFTEMINLM